MRDPRESPRRGPDVAVTLVLFVATVFPSASTSATAGRAAQLSIPDLALQVVATGLERPVFVAGLPGDPPALLIVEQRWRIRLVVGDRPRGRSFLNIRSKVSSGGERGLLSLAVAPGWPDEPYVFVNYTDLDGNTVIERYRARRSGRKLRRNTATHVLTIAQPFSNHNGGQLAFGGDEMLYVGTGDGGSGGDPQNNAQNLSSLLGKLLRIDVRVLPFTVPTDNPALPGVGTTAIWALGLRNPWRFAFDRLTDDLYIADVGQGAIEEIDFQAGDEGGGANYGWRVREGSKPFDSSTDPATLPLIDPIHEYDHGEGRSVTGGYVYRGAAIPELDGHYFYADFVTERIWSMRVRNGRARQHMEWTGSLRTVEDETLAVSSFGEGIDGELYVCSYYEGAVYRIVRR